MLRICLELFASMPLPGFTFAPDMLEAMRKNASKVAPRDKSGDMSARRIARELRKANKDGETWQRLKGAIKEVGLDKYIGKQVQDVEDDMKGNIEYDFSKEASLESRGSDYAGRELPNQPSLPTTVNYPYSEDHNNYNAEKTLKGKELERKLNKVKDFVLKPKK